MSSLLDLLNPSGVGLGNVLRLAVLPVAVFGFAACAGSESEPSPTEAPRDPLVPVAENHAHIRSAAGGRRP